MNQELEAKLFNRFKFFHPEASIKTSLMCFGMEHDNGWYQIIWDLCIGLEQELKKLGKEAEDQFRVTQVKEKFGTLRFYTNGHTDEMDDLITIAERKSRVTCEVCGEHGRLYTDGWHVTLCKVCRRKDHPLQYKNLAIRFLLTPAIILYLIVDVCLIDKSEQKLKDLKYEFKRHFDLDNSRILPWSRW